jgi:hypothetical protein
MVGIFALIVLVAIIVGVAWLGSRTKETGGNGDNRDAATRYGPGAGL